MPAASKLGWSSALRNASIRFLPGLVILCAAPPGSAEEPLRLKPSTQLSGSPGARPPAAQPAAPLRLSLSQELVMVPAGKPAPADDAVSEVLFQVEVNQQALKETVLLLRLRDGRFLMAEEDFARWRLRSPAAVPYEHRDQRYYPLDALPGTKLEVNEKRQTMSIATEAQAFAGTVAAVPRPQYPPPVLPQPGGFLNYAFAATQAPGIRTRSGAFEGGFFSRFGVLTSGILAPELSSTGTWLRLDTTFTADYPDRLTTLRLGDSVTQPGAWGRALRFGGVQYSTNFGTRPGFIRYPTQATGGTATLPSTVDVYVNNALVRRAPVPPGPFSVTDVPMISGAGEVRVVVRDLLGREHVITQPYYGSAELLRQGVEEFSYEAGVARKDFGVASARYGQWLGMATYRKGFTDDVTAELRGEHSAAAQAAGGSGTLRVGSYAVVNGRLAVSHSDRGIGQLAGLGAERSTAQMSYTVQSLWQTRDFRQVGMDADELPRRQQIVLGVGRYLGAMGALSASYVTQRLRDQPSAEIGSLTYTLPIGRIANLSINALRVFGGEGSTSLFAALAIPLGELTSGSAGLEHTRRKSDGRADTVRTLLVQKSLPYGDGFGYRVQAREKDLLGGLSAQTAIGTYTFEAEQDGQTDDTATRLSASGGIGMVGGYPFFSREITDSFGVVRVADYPGVRILQDNQLVGKTNAGGYVVLPRLRAYDRNQITVEQGDLPMDAAFNALKLDAVPYFRSGVLLDFPVRRIRAATLTVLLEDGNPVPAGALARLHGGKNDFPVGLQGELYVEGLEENSTVDLAWKGQRCVIELRYPKTDDPLPQLGNYLCRGVKP